MNVEHGAGRTVPVAPSAPEPATRGFVAGPSGTESLAIRIEIGSPGDRAARSDLLELPFRTWTDGAGAVIALGFTDGLGHGVRLPGLAHFEFDGTGETIRVYPEATPGSDILPDAAALREAFQRCVLPLLLHARGWEVLHASAVDTPTGVAAFCAPSGCGKSTIAGTLQLAENGFEAFCDDAVVLVRREAKWFALPDGASARDDPGVESSPAIGLYGARPLRAAFLLERLAPSSPAPAEAVRLHPTIALPRIVEHAHAFSLDDPDRMRRMAAAYLQLIAAVPVFELRFPGRLGALPEIETAVRRAMSELTDPGPP